MQISSIVNVDEELKDGSGHAGRNHPSPLIAILLHFDRRGCREQDTRDLSKS